MTLLLSSIIISTQPSFICSNHGHLQNYSYYHLAIESHYYDGEPEYDGVDVLAQLVEEEPVSKSERPAYPSHLIMIIIIISIVSIMLMMIAMVLLHIRAT